ADLLERHRLGRRAGAEGKRNDVAVMHDQVRGADVGCHELPVAQEKEAEEEALSRRIRALAEAALRRELATGFLDAADRLTLIERGGSELQPGKLEQLERGDDRLVEGDAFRNGAVAEVHDERGLAAEGGSGREQCERQNQK